MDGSEPRFGNSMNSVRSVPGWNLCHRTYHPAPASSVRAVYCVHTCGVVSLEYGQG